MAFFHPHAYPGQGFGPLFRMLEDFDRYSNAGTATGNRSHNGRGHLPTFQPKFDVRETESTYELHGELPGIQRENVNIEFSDADRLVVRGRVERSYTAGTPPAGLVGGANTGRITEAGEHSGEHAHQATVEDETDADAAGKHVAKQTKKHEEEVVASDGARYWVSERSIGEFSRSFQFPQRVDQDGVSASLTDGILTVVVPKAKKHESRRINIV